jgi:transglutaminase-like putative cysteine protease
MVSTIMAKTQRLARTLGSNASLARMASEPNASLVRVTKSWTVPLAIGALIAVAGLSLGRVYYGPLLAGLVTGAALGSIAVSVLMQRVQAAVVAAVSVAALGAYALVAIIISARTSGVAGDTGTDVVTLAVDAARNAVPRLLTALIPVEAQPDTVLGPVVLAWLAGFAGAELAVRARRPAVALVPPTLLYIGALVLVGPNADVDLWQPLAFAVMAAVAMAAGGAGTRALPRLSSGDRAALRLRAASGLGVGLVAVLAAVAVGAPLVARTVTKAPTDPRRYVEPPTLDVLDENPLIRISGWAANPDQRLFDVTVLKSTGRHPPAPTQAPSLGPDVVAAPPEDPPEEPPAPAGAAAYDTRLRLAVLSDWDGVTWHVDADYRNAGRVLPPVARPPGIAPPDPQAPPSLTITERITVSELQGRLLPAVSAPSRVDGVRVAYDPSSGTLLRAEPLSPGVGYTVTSVSPSVDVSLLSASDVPSGSSVARFLEVGDQVPPDLGRLAEKIAAGEGSPYLRALALEKFLSEHYRFAGDAPSGHAYPNLRFFLFDDPRSGGRRGTSEQFAAAFAALGRLMGMPTRVVVGFRTPSDGGPVTGADAVAWPEVLFTDVGWVAFNPLPEANATPRPLDDEFLPKPPPPTSPPSSVEPPEAPTFSAPPPSLLAADDQSGPGTVVIATGAGGGLLAVLAALAGIALLLRTRRRRAHLDRGDGPQRVLGAWDEVLDTLVLAGAPPLPHLSATEIASHAALVASTQPGRHIRGPRPAAPALDDLAAKVNAVGFAGGTARPVDDLVASGAKAQAIEYERALLARKPLWRRLLWRVDPRPLRRR